MGLRRRSPPENTSYIEQNKHYENYPYSSLELPPSALEFNIFANSYLVVNLGNRVPNRSSRYR
jgi:hypothetical protein